ncbi:hypothetical protein NE615_24995, partial [Escherichia coli]|nr:hypothetical protein [Escherichia coli]
VFDRVSAVVGEQVWNFADFATSQGILRVGGNKKGILLNNGHQRIGYLSSSHGIEDDTMRKAGWMSALKEQDIIPPESWIGTGTPDMPGGEAAMVELLGRNLQLTAVFAYISSSVSLPHCSFTLPLNC